MSPTPGPPSRAVALALAASALLGGCAPATSAPPPPPAAAAGPVDGSGGGRHGGGSAADAATWPAGVPLPPGRIMQMSAAQGIWQSTLLVDAGLAAACGSAASAYRDAGWTGPPVTGNPATEPVVLAGPGYRATIVCTAADHSPSTTLVTVHLSVV